MKPNLAIVAALLGAGALAGAGATAGPSPAWGPAISAEAPAGTSGALNTPALEGCPAPSPDGLSLYFASNRPGGLGNLDIWVATRPSADAPWGEPVNPGSPLNSADNDFCPTPLEGGHFLFVSNRPDPDGCGGADIYRTSLHPVGGWLRPENLGCAVNSAADEASPSYVAGPRRGFLYFSSTRPGGVAEGGTDADIYLSRLQVDGAFAAAELVQGVNTEFDDSRPHVRPNGLELFFDSTRPVGLGGADVWAASRTSLEEGWSAPANLGPNVNSADAETRPFLSHDGSTLYFGSTRGGGEGSQDLYVATRQAANGGR